MPPVEPVALHACNPGSMTGAGNQTYLLVSGRSAALIDAGVGHPDHLAALTRALTGCRASLELVAVTHHHTDHASGAPVLATAHPGARFVKYPWPGDGQVSGVGWRSLADGDEARFGEEALTAVHTPGHSPDHVAFWHRPSRALFTGDLVIAGGSVTIEASRGGNLRQYLASLERVLELEPSRLWPAHGPIVDDPQVLVRGYLEHRQARERQVVAALRAGHRTVEAIAESIYHGLEPRLLVAARENVRAHLEKLEADGAAACRDGWRML